MPIGIFVTIFPPENSLPPAFSGDGYCLQYIDENEELTGGYSCIGQTPTPRNTCMTWVKTSQATIDRMKTETDVLYLGELLPDQKPPYKLATVTYLMNWMNAHPLIKNKIENISSFTSVEDFIVGICKYHNIDRKDLLNAGL